MSAVTLTAEQLVALQKAVALLSAAGKTEASVSESGIVTDDGDASPRGKTMHRVHGPYSERGKWRIKIVDRATKKSENRVFATREEADLAAESIRKKAAKEVGISVGAALVNYKDYLSKKGNKERTIETTMYRVGSLFASLEKFALVAVTKSVIEQTFTSYIAAQELSTDSARNTLSESKTFLRWCVARQYLKINPLEQSREIAETLGKRKRGKMQLTKDEARRWLTLAVGLIGEGDTGALAATTALLMGMRASEVADRIVRNLDDDCHILWITDAKTQAGVRRLQIPELIQSAFRKLATGKNPSDRLFGDVNRHWVLRAVRRLCKAAKVTIVGPHGLRGTHASLAVSAGVTGAIVAAALGHESFATTTKHYATPESVSIAQQDAFTNALQN